MSPLLRPPLHPGLQRDFKIKPKTKNEKEEEEKDEEEVEAQACFFSSSWSSLFKYKQVYNHSTILS
jgi:hypothetical protein